MTRGTPAVPMAAAHADEFHLVFPERVYRDLQDVLFPGPESTSDHPFAGKAERGAYCVLSRSTGENRVSFIAREVLEPDSPDDLTINSPNWIIGEDEESDEADQSGVESQESGIGRYIPGNTDTEDGMGSGSDSMYGFQFTDEYRQRALQRARELDGGILRIHTHPHGSPLPSRVDRKSAEQVFSRDVDRLSPGAPLAAAIITEDEAWSARAYEFPARDELLETYASRIGIVGPAHRKGYRKLRAWQPNNYDGELDLITAEVHSGNSEQERAIIGSEDIEVATDEQDSTLQLWGSDGQELLADLTVGVVGCGGVGSILAEHLARLGVGHLVFVDFDRLERANANRAQGATPEDIKQNRLKTHVAKRVAEQAATAPEFEATIVDGSPVEQDPEYAAVPKLLDCDIIVSAVDAARPRKVLDHVASAHCIPVIDGGSRLHVDDGMLRPDAKIEIAATGPGWPCFECQRVWNSDGVYEEREDPRFRGDRAYVDEEEVADEDDRDPSVIGINAIAAGMMQRRFKAITLGIASRLVGTVRVSPLDLYTQWMHTADCRGEECNRAPIGAGDRHSLPTGTDWAMRTERSDIDMPETRRAVSSFDELR
jgi:hypothetical protein